MTLFMMMLPTGIKELQGIEDVCYLRETLAVEKNEQVTIKIEMF
jgi:phosphatidylinositol-4,5-bisphosphate 3-kinase